MKTLLKALCAVAAAVLTTVVCLFIYENDRLVCALCLAVSAVTAVFFFIDWLVSFVQRSRGKFSLQEEDSSTPFYMLVGGVFLAAMLMFVPVYINNLGPITVGTLLKVPLLSAHNSLRLFVVDADFGDVRDVIGGMSISQGFKDLYTMLFVLYYVFAPLLTAAFLLSLIRGLYERMRYRLTRSTNKLYVFSELNESSIVLASDIINAYRFRDEDVYTENELACTSDLDPNARPESVKGRPRPVRRTVVFAGVNAKLKEEHPELVERARSLGAMCLEAPITEINLKSPAKDIHRRLYVIGEREDDNIDTAITLIEKCRRRYNSPKTFIYVFATSEESGLVLESCVQHRAPADGDDGPCLVKVRRVDEARSFVWSTLMLGTQQLQDWRGKPHQKDNVPYVFDSATPPDENGVRNINVLLVGMGGYGAEFLRTLTWFCQLPKYRLTVHVMDGAVNCSERIRAVAPDLVAHNDTPSEGDGDAYYKIVFHNEAIDVNSFLFTQKIMEIEQPLTMVAVMLGDDDVNIDTAIKLRRVLGQKVYKQMDAKVDKMVQETPGISLKEAVGSCTAEAAELNSRIPYILTAVYSSEKARALDWGRALDRYDINGRLQFDNRIRFVGDTESRLSMQSIEQLRLERLGRACHMLWSWSLIENGEAGFTTQMLQLLQQYGSEGVSAEEKKALSAQINALFDAHMTPEKADAWRSDAHSFDAMEYNRIASKSQGMQLIVRTILQQQLTEGVAPEQVGELFARYEHRRWAAYVRSVGYVPSYFRDGNVKVHRSLVPYERLSKSETDKDKRSWTQAVMLANAADAYIESMGRK